MRHTVTRREFVVATAGLGAATVLGTDAGAQTAVDPQGPFVQVPGGPFLMGTTKDQAARLARAHGYHVSWFDGEVPQRTVEVAGFAIQKHPVTNRQFAAFCLATGYRVRPHWHGAEPPADILDHPVTYVNLPDAMAYAKWAGLRLPMEAEWEKAARGTDGRAYPWGNRFDGARCRWAQAPPAGSAGGPHVAAARQAPDAGRRGPGTVPVGSHPSGASPYGAMDMAGNVGEWCADGPGPGAAYIKGGCWLTVEPVNLRPASRSMSGFATNSLPFYGFRCVKEVR